MRQHLKARRDAAHQACNRAADRVGHQQACGYATFFLLERHFGSIAGEHVGHAGVERWAGSTTQGLHQQAFEWRVDGDHTARGVGFRIP